MASYAGPSEYFGTEGICPQALIFAWYLNPVLIMGHILPPYDSHLIWKCPARLARGDNISLATFDDRTQDNWNTL